MRFFHFLSLVACLFTTVGLGVPAPKADFFHDLALQNMKTARAVRQVNNLEERNPILTAVGTSFPFPPTLILEPRLEDINPTHKYSNSPPTALVEVASSIVDLIEGPFDDQEQRKSFGRLRPGTG